MLWIKGKIEQHEGGPELCVWVSRRSIFDRVRLGQVLKEVRELAQWF